MENSQYFYCFFYLLLFLDGKSSLKAKSTETSWIYEWEQKINTKFHDTIENMSETQLNVVMFFQFKKNMNGISIFFKIRIWPNEYYDSQYTLNHFIYHYVYNSLSQHTCMYIHDAALPAFELHSIASQHIQCQCHNTDLKYSGHSFLIVYNISIVRIS